MKLELAPSHEEQSTCVIRWGQDSSTYTSHLLGKKKMAKLFLFESIKKNPLDLSHYSLYQQKNDPSKHSYNRCLVRV